MVASVPVSLPTTPNENSSPLLSACRVTQLLRCNVFQHHVLGARTACAAHNAAALARTSLCGKACVSVVTLTSGCLTASDAVQAMGSMPQMALTLQNKS